MTHSYTHERGQTSLVFVATLVIIIGAFALLIDGGRYLVMRSQARMMTDASALSGASIIDVDEAKKGNFVLETSGADKEGNSIVTASEKAVEIFKKNKEDTPPWTLYQIDVRVYENEIWVKITGHFSPVFGSGLGLSYSTSVTSSARAAVGISEER